MGEGEGAIYAQEYHPHNHLLGPKRWGTLASFVMCGVTNSSSYEGMFVFQEDDGAQALENRLKKLTKFEAWFRLYETQPDGRRYNYVGIPDYFVWDQPTGS